MNTPQDFVYWLQGFVEIADSDTISEKQWLIIKDHLKLVFDKVTQDRGITISAPEIRIGSPDVYDKDTVKKMFDKLIPPNPYAATC